MIEIAALLLALTLGCVIGILSGVHWAAKQFGRTVRRELDAGRIDRGVALRLTDFREPR